MTYKIGDVVQLASGGVLMTITKIDGAEIECHWFEANKQRSKTFPTASLKIGSAPLTLEQLVTASYELHNNAVKS